MASLQMHTSSLSDRVVDWAASWGPAGQVPSPHYGVPSPHDTWLFGGGWGDIALCLLFALFYPLLRAGLDKFVYKVSCRPPPTSMIQGHE